MKYFVGLLLVLLPFFSLSRYNEDYREYHRIINRAEEHMFINADYRTARKGYDSAFKAFDFVFLKDCIISAQLAAFNGDIKSSVSFLKKGFENGLKIEDLGHLQLFNPSNGSLERVTVFDKMLSTPVTSKELSQSYKKGRKKYLSRVSTKLRIAVDSVFIYDQLSKNNSRGMVAKDPNYQFVENRFDDFYSKTIKDYGFPGEKIVGVDDTALMEELKQPSKSILKIYDTYYSNDSNRYNAKRHQFTMDYPFTAVVPIIPLLHNSCSFNNLSPFYDDQIKKGNLHPRDAAYLLDFFASSKSEEAGRRCKRSDFPLPYYTNVYRPQSAGPRLREVNEKRKDFNIVSLEVDSAKYKYSLNNRLLLFFGFFDHL